MLPPAESFASCSLLRAGFLLVLQKKTYAMQCNVVVWNGMEEWHGMYLLLVSTISL